MEDNEQLGQAPTLRDQFAMAAVSAIDIERDANYDWEYVAVASREGQVTYPAEICCDCGRKHGSRVPAFATFYYGKCGWCGIETVVTEPRDYGYPKWKEKK